MQHISKGLNHERNNQVREHIGQKDNREGAEEMHKGKKPLLAIMLRAASIFMDIQADAIYVCHWSYHIDCAPCMQIADEAT